MIPVPIWALLVILLASCVSTGGAYWLGRSDGKAAIQAEWDADKAERIRRTTEIVLQQYEVAATIERKQRESVRKFEENEREFREQLKAKNAKINALLGDVAKLRVSPAFVRVFNESAADSAVAESAGGAAKTAAPAAPASGDSSVSVGELAAVCTANLARHNRCVDMVLGWQEFYSRLQATCGDSK